MSRLLIFLFLIFVACPSFPQSDALVRGEASLRELFEQLYQVGSDAEKKRMNDSILGVMAGLLASPTSFEYPFDSLQRIGNVRSPDNTFRIFTWNVPLSGFVHEYHGIIQKPADRNRSCHVTVMKGKGNRLEDMLDAEFGGHGTPFP